MTAIYLINRTPTPLLDNKSHFEIPFKVPPKYSHLRTFECLCFAATLSRHKFDPCDRRCVFLGYPFGVKGYKLLDIDSNVVFLSRDVTIHEHVFPFHHYFSTPSQPSPSMSPTSPLYFSPFFSDPLSDPCPTTPIEISPQSPPSP